MKKSGGWLLKESAAFWTKRPFFFSAIECREKL
jgi:hypothetical protein